MATLNYTYNAVGGRAVIHATANATIVIAGNNTVSNVATTSQVLTGASISKIWFGAAPSGYWNVLRGANLVASFESSGTYEFNGAALNVDKTANVVVQLMGASNGFIIIELHKEGVL